MAARRLKTNEEASELAALQDVGENAGVSRKQNYYEHERNGPWRQRLAVTRVSKAQAGV